MPRPGIARTLGAALVASAAALGSVGCTERVRDCGGGVEVVIAVEDRGALERAGDELIVRLEVEGEVATRRFGIRALDAGQTSFTIDLDRDATVDLHVTVEVPYAGPGTGAPTPVLRGEGSIVVTPSDRGCGRLEVVLNPAPDGDGDGVPDGADVCPGVADPGQEDGDGDLVGDACDGCPALAFERPHDEDGDGVPDACDPCPHLHPGAGDPRADADDDGVGDDCDPNPFLPGERLALFLAFDDPAQLDDLIVIGDGTVTWADGAVELAADREVALLFSEPLGRFLRIATHARRISHLDLAQWGEGIVAWQDVDAPELDAWVCMAHETAIEMKPWPFFVGPPPPPGPATGPNAFKFDAYDDGGVGAFDAVLRCSINGAGQEVQAAPPVLRTGFGLFVSKSRVRFDYLLVVDSP